MQGEYLKEQSPQEGEKMAQVGEFFDIPVTEDKMAR